MKFIYEKPELATFDATYVIKGIVGTCWLSTADDGGGVFECEFIGEPEL